MKAFLKFAAAAAAAATLAAPVAVPVTAAAANAPCFSVRDWKGWSAPSDNEVLLRVGKDIYRVEVSGGAGSLRSPGAYIISTSRGGGAVCSAIDLDLKIADSGGFRTSLIAKSLTKLTPEEAKAVPKKDQP